MHSDLERSAPLPIPDAVVDGKRKHEMPELDKLFRAAVKFGASDVHIKAENRPRYRVKGDLKSVANMEPIPAQQLENMIGEITSDEQQKELLQMGTIDFAHDLDEHHRFRVNVFRQRGKLSLVGRLVKAEIPDFKKLFLPPVIEKLASEAEAGLILLAGITGSGKSTTIASMIEHMNATRALHIITVEDPIEFTYIDKKSLINQREIGIDVPTFGHALRTILREDPDVILVGELRDKETFEAALQASETGHLVFGTVHASSASQTVTRILDLFPAEDRELVRQNFAFNLQAIVCQKLVPTGKSGMGRVPAVEILLGNSVARKYILDKRDNELPEVIRKYQQDGMIEFNESLRQLVEGGFIDHKTAYEYSPNPEELRMRLKGIMAK